MKPTKQLLFERTITVGLEKLALHLFRAKGGLLLERSLGQGDGRMLVQVLPLLSRDDLHGLDEFIKADEHRNYLLPLYNEVREKAAIELV